MSDIAGLNLKQPTPMDWDKFNPHSGYQAPPPAEGEDGRKIVYTGRIPKKLTFEADDDNNLQVLVDPLTIVGPHGAGQTLRFARGSVKPFERNGKPQNVNGFGKFLRAAGSTAKPQTNEQYVSAANAVAGKTVTFTLDWEAKNKDTGETIKGYRSFPEDPERPGLRKSILHAGDTYNVIDSKGTIIGQATVKSEVLFANARFKNFTELNKVAQSATGVA